LNSAVLVRDAVPSELAEVGDLRVTAYTADGFLSPSSRYVPTLRALGTNGDGDVLVAVADGQLAGTVTLLLTGEKSELITGPGDAEIRALAVAPGARRQGTGRALLTAVIARAAQRGIGHLLLYTQREMVAAQHLYASAGFARIGERDTSPMPGVTLLAYGLLLPSPG
jgi:ribosomal protein S18 acetylase RimI-like enzyme